MAISIAMQGTKRQAKAPTFPIDARIYRAITGLAESDCPVLIVGEVGVGKRFMAAQIHTLSHRSRSIFLEISAADASSQQVITALSSRGTVYLSEVADLSAAQQGLILEHYSNAKEPQSRLLCGTSRELMAEMKSRRLREDFFHFISAVTLQISPLRFRKSEILSIADELLTEYSKQFDRPRPVLSQGITDFLMEHSWPGNLTELQTAIKTFVIIGDQSISLAALKASTSGAKHLGAHRSKSLKEATRAASIEVERQLISEVLAATGGNRKRAADELGISYKALLYKLKQAETEGQRSSNENGLRI